MSKWISTWIVAAGVLFAGFAAHAASGADPTGAAPIGVITHSGARGPKLVGVIVVEFVGVGTGTVASSARVTLRLRRGTELAAVFAEVAGPLDTEATPAVQTAIFDALDQDIKKTFFADECVPDSDGVLCPNAVLLLKGLDEFALADDEVANQIMIADVTIALDARP